MADRIPRVLRAVLLIWTAITFLPAWLVMIRGLFDGEPYAWGFSERIRGRGTGGSYPLIPPLAAFGVTILALGWGGATRPFHLLLALWHVPISVAASIAARRNREALRLQGDTLGIDISLADVAPVVLGGVTAGSVALAILEKPHALSELSGGPDRRILSVVLAIVPLQFILLRTGKQHGWTDKTGVILTIGQWALMNLALARREIGTQALA